MQTTKTFLFDLDGTLVDSVADLATAVNALRAELYLPALGIDEVRSCIGDGVTLLVRRALPEGSFTPQQVQRFLALYAEHLIEQTAPYPGIRDFLELHRDRKMAVVTNKPYQLAHDLLAGLDLLPYFTVVIGGDSCASKKPEPEPVLRALELLLAKPQHAVMIGDHHTDLKAGRAAGVRTCFCTYGLGNNGGLTSDFEACQPSDLARIFPGTAV